jgi:L-rhamnose isomerase
LKTRKALTGGIQATGNYRAKHVTSGVARRSGAGPEPDPRSEAP